MEPEKLTTTDKFWLLLFAALLVAGLLFAPPATSEPLGPGDRGYRHKEFHHTYSKWHNQLGTHCCNTDGAHGDGDCRITEARWNHQAGMWEALADGVWVLITDDRHVQDDYGLGPDASVCVSKTGIVWCFDAPTGMM